jgi:hypothetical protein
MKNLTRRINEKMCKNLNSGGYPSPVSWFALERVLLETEDRIMKFFTGLYSIQTNTYRKINL